MSQHPRPSQQFISITETSAKPSTAAGNDANTTIRVEYDDSLNGWATAVHQGSAANQITITEVPNGFGAGIDKVTVALPPGLASSGKLFARLKVMIATS